MRETPNTLEELKTVLQHPNILDLGWYSKDPHNLERYCNFSVKYHNEVFGIEWWCNQSYLTVGQTIIPFVRVRKSNTWPMMGYKLFLQFYDINGEVCCVIPLENWEEA